MKKSYFAQLIHRNFIALEKDFNFKRTGTSFHEGGVVVTFQNPTTEVCLNYEIGEYPWITIADINNPKKDRISLDWLLVELGQRETPTTDEAFFPPSMEDDELEFELQKRSKQLTQFADQLLKGDFSTLPKLTARANAYLLECQKFAKRYQA